MTGSAASKKQPTFEQFSLVDMINLHRRDDPASALSRRSDARVRIQGERL
jgi:hypothetical protein